MNKTVIVDVGRLFVHKLYKKVIKRVDKFNAHDEERKCVVGDKVKIVETRPLSKTKRWRVDKIIGQVGSGLIKENDTSSN
jgi:small subunit ribosomal protein S17